MPGSGSNLPPGVSVNMIPGNRPEDEWNDIFWDHIEVPAELTNNDPKEIAKHVNDMLVVFTALHTRGYQEGLSEGRLYESDEPEDVILPRCQSTMLSADNVRVQCERTDGHPGDHYNYTRGNGWSDVS